MTEPTETADEPKRYLVRTFGCQMNEHDSERIAGLFDADGMEATDDLESADVVVLNTCCIRENADNKLYGTLGHLKSLKDRRPGMEIVVSGCLAQKDKESIRERAPYVDLVFGTHNVHQAAELLARSRAEGPLTEILEHTVADDHELFPSAMPARRELGHAAWVTIQIGCDNSCAFCIVPAVRGEEISRPYERLLDEVRGLAADGVSEVTLLGQNVNSYGRDLTLAARQAGDDVRVRPLFADLLRDVGAIEGIERVRYTSPHPKDLRPETISAMAETPAVCEHLHLPVQSGSDRVLAAMHRGYTAERYLEKLTAAHAEIADLAVTTDLIVGFPGETDQDFEDTLALAAAAEYDSAYTFIYSPRPGTEAAEMVEQFIAADVVAARFERLHAVVERTALRAHEARVGRVEEIVVEGPSRKDPGVLTGRTRQNKLVHFASTAPIRVGTYATVLVTGAAPHHLRGEMQEILAAPPATAPASPSPPADRTPTAMAYALLPEGAPPPLAIVGTTASGKSALAMALARSRGDVELVSVDSMQVYRGMDIGTAKPTTAEQAEVRHHVIDLVDPWEPFEVHSFQQAVADALADIAERGRRAVLVGGTGLYLQAVIDGFEIPGRFPEVLAELEADPDTEALHARLATLDPVAASRMEPTNRRRVIRALEVTVGSGRPFSSYGPGVGTHVDTPVRIVGIRLPTEVVAARIERRYHQQMSDGFLDEVRRLHAGPALSRTAAQALGYRELLGHLDALDRGEDALTLEDALDEAVRRTRGFARRQRAWFRRDPRIEWLDAESDPMDRVADLEAIAAAHWPAPS